MPYNATNAVTFARTPNGRYRDGECWTLIEDAVTGNGGKSSRVLTPNFSPNSNYVWGTVVAVNALQPGDVLQFTRYNWTRTTVTEVTNPDGGGTIGTTEAEESRGEPRHTAMVLRVISTGVVEVVEQNIPPLTGPVQVVQLVLTAQPPSVTTTRVPAQNGATVTVTTVTDRVTNPPRCYRPVSA